MPTARHVRTDHLVFAAADQKTSSAWLGALWQPAPRWLAGVFVNAESPAHR